MTDLLRNTFGYQDLRGMGAMAKHYAFADMGVAPSRPVPIWSWSAMNMPTNGNV